MKKKVFLSIITALLCIGAVVAGVFAYKDYKENLDPSQTKQWLKIATPIGEIENLRQSDFENIFFSTSLAKYYQLSDGNFAEYPCEVLNVGLELFGKRVEFPLNFINVDGNFFGFATYDDGTTHYFIKATNVPASSGYSTETNCLLLFDSAKDGCQGERLYEESFVLDLTKNAVRGRYVADRYRAVAEDGSKRDDYAMLTTEMLQKAAPNRVHFLTRSFYAPSNDPYRTVDVNTIATGYTAASTLTDVILNYAYDTEGGIFYFKRGENEFYSMLGTGAADDKVICTFKGDYIKDYIRQGDYLVNISESKDGKLSVTNAITAESKEILMEKGFSQVNFAVMNNDKTRLLLAGEWEHTNKTGTYTLQNIALINLENSDVQQFVGIDLFGATQRPYFVETQPIIQMEKSILMPKFK